MNKARWSNGFDYEAIAKELSKARGTCYFTGEKPTHEDLVEMVEEADDALSDTFGYYREATIKRVVRRMLIDNDTASRICANPLNLEARV